MSINIFQINNTRNVFVNVIYVFLIFSKHLKFVTFFIVSMFSSVT
jgi:hypothetical protein